MRPHYAISHNQSHIFVIVMRFRIINDGSVAPGRHRAVTHGPVWRTDKMINQNTAPYGALLLRVSLGVLFLIHASLKIFVFTPAGTAQFFESLGLPGFLAYLTI